MTNRKQQIPLTGLTDDPFQKYLANEYNLGYNFSPNYDDLDMMCMRTTDLSKALI